MERYHGEESFQFIVKVSLAMTMTSDLLHEEKRE